MQKNMKNFTVGPVMMDEQTLLLGSEQIPYFRTPEFSEILLENESLLCRFANAGSSARVIFMTASGTASMEAAVINCFTPKDKLLVVNGGTFGQRFCDICSIHGLDFTEIKLPPGKPLTAAHLTPFDGRAYTGLIMQHHETSTGLLYDLSAVSQFCKNNGIFLLLDCISSFCAENIDMESMGVNAAIIGSQKAIALPPGISCIILDRKAQERIRRADVKSMYFNLKEYLKDGERGQTPFTPAVSVLLQMNDKLNRICAAGGIQTEIDKTAERAAYFRSQLKNLPFALLADTPSNAVTALQTPPDMDAHRLFKILKDSYHIFICPNGGELAHSVFRVGHIGAISREDTDALITALHEITAEGLA